MVDRRDIQWDTYTNSTPVVGMKLTHLPTGLQVTGSSKYRYKLREQLMNELEGLIKENDKKNIE